MRELVSTSWGTSFSRVTRSLAACLLVAPFLVAAGDVAAGTHSKGPARPTSPVLRPSSTRSLAAKMFRPQAALSVTTTADAGAGSLRNAVAAAVSGDTISFAVTGSIQLSTGEISILNNITIAGPGASQLAVNGGGAGRVFNVAEDTTVAISGLTITGGFASGGDGGGILNGGSLTVDGCRITGNTADGYGGGIANHGNLTVRNSSLTGNRVNNSYGGAIEDWGALTVVNSTMSSNVAGSDGGATSLDGGVATFVNVTIADNVSGGVGGGVWGDNVEASVLNTLIAQNTDANGAPDWTGSMNSQGHNLVGNTAGLTINGITAGNILDTAARISPLALNMAQTFTNSLRFDSPAVDAGDPAAGLLTDQRGFPRAGAPDIGAYERQPTDGPDGPVQPIPTLDHRGLAAMGLLVAAAGVLLLKRLSA